MFLFNIEQSSLRAMLNSLLLTFTLSFTFIFCSSAKGIPSNPKYSAEPLRIAVSSNFTPVLKKLLTEFHQKTNISTQIVSGATGAIFIQIQHGAPFDIFIAADNVRPTQLEQQGLILPGSRQTYALGQLALFSKFSKLQLDDLNNLPHEKDQRLAIANPETAPYGKAAKQALEHLGVWHHYESKLIMGININQTFTQVRSKAVNSGLVANSQLVLNQLEGAVVPSAFHQPITQQLAIIKKSNKVEEAKRLSEYLLSPNIQKKIVSYGYARLKDGND